MKLPKDLLDIVCDYLHCDLEPVPDGLALVLRPCQAFDVVVCDGKMMVFPCRTT